VFSSNGDGFLFHDRSVTDRSIEAELTLDAFSGSGRFLETVFSNNYYNVSPNSIAGNSIIT
jgi:hypothetical protein